MQMHTVYNSRSAQDGWCLLTCCETQIVANRAMKDIMLPPLEVTERKAPAGWCTIGLPQGSRSSFGLKPHSLTFARCVRNLSDDSQPDECSRDVLEQLLVRRHIRA